MLDESLPPDRPGDAGQRDSTEYDDQIHVRRATSLLRLLKSNQELAHENADLKREFLQLTALLRRIDQLASEQEIEQEVFAVNNERAPVNDSEIEPNGTNSVFEPAMAEDEPVSPIASDQWDDSDAHLASSEPDATSDTDEDEVGSGESSTFPEEVPFDPTEFDPVPPPATESIASEPEQVSSDDGSEPRDDPDLPTDNLRRWWVTFSGNVRLEKLSLLRQRLSDSPFTLDARFDEIADGMIVLRVVTDRSITMQQTDWIIRELMDTVGLDRDSAILTPQ